MSGKNTVPDFDDATLQAGWVPPELRNRSKSIEEGLRPTVPDAPSPPPVEVVRVLVTPAPPAPSLLDSVDAARGQPSYPRRSRTDPTGRADATILIPSQHDRTILRPDPGPDLDPTMDPPTRRMETPVPPAPPSARSTGSTWHEVKEIAKDFLHKHQKIMWWAHTAYALALGTMVASFANKGFDRAKILAASLSAAWIVFILFFRFFGTGSQQDFVRAWPGMRRRFFVMTYILKNLLQSMLFFLLPFYWKSTSMHARTFTFFVLIAICAVLSTLDLVFDRLLMRFKTIASLFYTITIFGSLNLVIPAFFSDMPALRTMLIAAGLSMFTFWLFHMPLASLLRKGPGFAFLGVLVVGIGSAYYLRQSIPPVPMHIASGGVGTAILPDGRLSMEVSAIHVSQIRDLVAVTEVMTPGDGDRFIHVWRRDKEEVYREHEAEPRKRAPNGNVLVRSIIPQENLPQDLVGRWTLDVETEDEQLVGRVVFVVKE